VTVALDPARFVLDALASEGALVEASELLEPDVAQRPALALLPRELAERLELPEECRLAARVERAGDAVACGFGSPLLERLLSDARRSAPIACCRLDAPPPRASQARALAERFVVRNGVSAVGDARMAEACYVRASFAWVAEGDDRHEGTVSIVASVADGAEPAESFAARLDPLLDAGGDGIEDASAPRPDLSPLSIVLARRADAAARRAMRPALDGAQRRHARDHRRIAEYFAQRAEEARKPRRRVDPAAIQAKLAALCAERDSKLRELGPRYALRVALAPAAFVAVTTPVALVRVMLRRRKATREIELRLPPSCSSLDQPTCDGCALPAARPAACDDALHLLCEACAPGSQGRIQCPACRCKG
jgi:hypothetical protein